MTNKKRTVIVFGVIMLLLATAGLVAATILPSAEELLVASLETIDTVTSGHAVVEGRVETPEQDFSGRVEVWGELDKGPNGEPAVRLEVQEASDGQLVDITLVSDGAQFWLYSPDQGSVVVGQVEEMAAVLTQRMAAYEGQWDHEGVLDPEATDHPQTPAEAIEKLLEYFSVERAGSADIAENRADLLRLVPIAEKMPEEVRLAGGFINLWLRDSDQLPLAVEYAEGAVGYVRVEASQIQINEPIDPGLFSFDIPPGTEVIQADELLAQMETLKQSAEVDETAVLTPTELPEGSEAAATEQFGGAIVQRFSLPDERSFVVAQGSSMPNDVPAEATSSETVTVRGVDGILYTDDDASRTLLIWQEGDLFFMVAGDLAPDQALVVAESLE